MPPLSASPTSIEASCSPSRRSALSPSKSSPSRSPHLRSDTTSLGPADNQRTSFHGELELPLLDLTAVQCNSCMLTSDTSSLFEDMSDMAASAYEGGSDQAGVRTRDKYSVDGHDGDKTRDSFGEVLPLTRSRCPQSPLAADKKKHLKSGSRVRFAPKPVRKCVYILHRKDYTRDEKAATWYTLEEYQGFRTSRRVAVENMEREGRLDRLRMSRSSSLFSFGTGKENVPRNLNHSNSFYNSIHARKTRPYHVGDEFCTRGLENKTRDGSRRRHTCIMESVAAVLEEQDYQQLTHRVDQLKLAHVYMNHTLSSQVLARQQALLDARDARAILREAKHEFGWGSIYKSISNSTDENDLDDASVVASCGSSSILPYPSMPFLEIVSL